jgi:uncharacterized glyoxalase superfamily protein PhnB
MPDPFEALREPTAPVAPRASFARELRRRIANQLGLAPKESHVPEIREYTPARLHSMTPYLSCLDAHAAIEWYQTVFDAVLLSDPIIMDDGSVGHAELRVGDSVFMLAGEHSAESHLSPQTLGGSSAAFQLYVPDADETYGRAVANGATALRPLAENYGARQGTIRDPFGHRWFICTALQPDDLPVEDTPGRRMGDVGYITLMVPDGERARRFYEALFGWSVRDGHEPGSFHIASITPPAGIAGSQDTADVRLYFRVDDIESAVAKVRELGGEVLAVSDYESGGNAECVDDQGLRFDLFRPRPGY